MRRPVLTLLAAFLFPALGWGQEPNQQPSDDGSVPMRFSGISIISATGRVELLNPGKPEYRPAGSLPVPLGVGMELRTGTLSKALLELEEGGLVSLAPHSKVQIANPLCVLTEGRLRAVAPTRQVVAVGTGAVPIRINGRSFSVEMPGKGKGKMAALGNGRAIAAKLIAAKGFVEVQLPFGTVRAEEMPLTLHEGTVVQTAANSFALIVFPDGSRVKLRADSTAAVDNETRCTVAAGAADVQLSDKGKLEVRTIDRQARVRGPAFTIDVNPQGEIGPALDEPPLPAPGTEASLPGGSGWDSSGGR